MVKVMASVAEILEPLTVFCKHRQSIKTWEPKSTPSDRVQEIYIETTFGLSFCIHTDATKATQTVRTIFSDPVWTSQSRLPSRTSYNFATSTRSYAALQQNTEPQSTKACRSPVSSISLDEDDPLYNSFENIRYSGASSSLHSWPDSIKTSYERWLDEYEDRMNTHFDRADDTDSHLWDSLEEEVAWHVEGFLLAWRISMMKGIDNVVYFTGVRYEFPPGGQWGADLLLAFLSHMVEVLKSESSS
ncbi:MAG: hypothetical protein M1820_004821 [Bogoriella megaspora]|nr:MAG: hypothetical protein M1820_004821 [Bogoriella megaspora]